MKLSSLTSSRKTITSLALAFMVILAGPGHALAAGPAPVNLLTAGNFTLLSKTGITNTGSHGTSITGNIGSSPITAAAMNGVFCSEMTGFIYGVDAAYTGSGATACFAGNPGVPAVSPADANKTLVDVAVLDMGTAYGDAAGRTLPTSTELGAGNIGGMTLAPGLYKWTTDVTIPTSVTLSGSASDVWIFQIAGNLSIASGGSVPAGVKVILSGGAKPSNIFWQVGGGTGATLGTYSTFNGNILSAKQVIMQTGAVFTGRAYADTQITLDANTITSVDPVVAPANGTLNVIKHVVNTGGGAATASSFSMHVRLAGVDVSGSPAAGSETGTSYSLAAGTYSVSESSVLNYTQTFSGDCDSSGNVIVTSGGAKTCTVTNTYVAPVVPASPATLHVVKLVVNGLGGTALASNFSLHVKNAGVDVAGSPEIGTVTPGTSYTLNAGTYTVSEDAHAGYTQVFSGDCDASGNITLAASDVKTCTIINTSVPLPAASTGGGSSFAPLPLINITKVPSPLALPAGPGMVTYTYVLTNVGQVATYGVWVKDNACANVTYISGDTNKDNVLDMNETWTYTCTKMLNKTETNTVVAHGAGSGWDGYDSAIATVVVGSSTIPPLVHVVKKPNTFVLPAGGGPVTYSYTVTNPGTAPLSNVVITDNKCTGLPGRVVGHPGDLNHNNLLESNESWNFTCQTYLTQTTTNIGTVTADANGMTAVDLSPATVVVASPSFPNTGLSENSSTMPHSLSKAKGAKAFYRSVKMGMRGADVSELQTFLEEKGFLTIPSTVGKGYFGGLTKSALTSYQESVGLPKVGIFGPQTKAQLLSELE